MLFSKIDLIGNKYGDLAGDFTGDLEAIKLCYCSKFNLIAKTICYCVKPLKPL
jgi:hypothetical protein